MFRNVFFGVCFSVLMCPGLAKAEEFEPLQLTKEKFEEGAADQLSQIPSSKYSRLSDRLAKLNPETKPLGFVRRTRAEDVPDTLNKPLLLAQESGGTDSAAAGDAGGEQSLADLSKKLNNPVSDLWMLFFQHDSTLWNGDISSGDVPMHNFKFQPVMALPFNDDYRLIIRPVISINSFDTPSLTMTGVDFDRETGIGDTVLLAMLSPKKLDMPWVVGAGLTSLIPTGGSDLGAENWAIGPAATVFYIGNTWTFGTVAQQWWSIDGESDRQDVNLMDVQLVMRYRLNATTQIGLTPNLQFDWSADTDDRYKIPIGFGFDKMSKIGKFPVRWGAEIQYYLETPDTFGPEWGARIFFIPVIPNPFRDKM
jgi:hypothetical protein